MRKQENNQIIIFNDTELTLEVTVSPKEDTVWLSLNQISKLFDKNKSTISRHISNIISEEEIVDVSCVAKNATQQINKYDPRTGANRKTLVSITYYNLDMIIAVGYRVKSRRATQFRKWATGILKQYAIKGYVLNQSKISYEKQLQLIQILERTANQIEALEILSILEQYTLGLQLLDDYDHQRIQKPKGKASTYKITYDECIYFINEMKRQHESDIFGIERGGAFKSSIGTIYQTFEGNELYPTLEEKAAHFLYFLVKNHGFVDGNKRIAAALFVYFLGKNKSLAKDGVQVISNKTLVALTIMLAESNPNEKELLVNLIMNLMKY